VKTRFTPILLILVIIAAAILSRFVGNSDYLYAESSNVYGYAYKFFFCPYNKPPYTNPNYPYPYVYRGYPTIRVPTPYAYPLPKQYPCPCSVPAIDPLLLEYGD
jgi:hypothetical protein